ncbi:prepilin-type N-terminal cleavage/methylation domain-containing protein [Planctomycetota bacterium]|nr:prepilin-type N-terminal cleavage/methylation domain-containing protein [Planctomycetota bacterium]
MLSKHRKHDRTGVGYTLIEVLIVVAIIAVAGAVVVPTMVDVGSMGVQAAARMVIADMLHAQNDAIAKQKPRKVKFDVFNDVYSLIDEAGKTMTVAWKGSEDGNYVVNFKDDVRFRGVDIKRVDFGGEVEVIFDELGTPSDGGFVELAYNGELYQIRVAAFTGKVTVEKIES